MATGTNLAFNHTTKLIAQGLMDFDNDTFKIVACNGAPTAAMTLKSSLTAASNLSAATKTLGSVAVTTTNTDDVKIDWGDVTFTATGASTITHFAIYNDTRTSPLDALVCYGDVDTGATSVSLANGEKLKIQFAAGGTIQIVDAA